MPTMKYIRETTKFRIEQDTVVSLGKFDGIHRGHEQLLERMWKKREQGLKTVLFTFDIPPNPGRTPNKVLTTNREKQGICERLGIDYLVECPFVDEIRCMDAEEFLAMLSERLQVKAIVAGKDFHFGYQRRGDYHMLREYQSRYGYEATVVDKICYKNREISSTYIREEVLKGDMKIAYTLLGYHYFIQGIVQHGRHMGETVFGIPTVNVLPPEEKLLPPFGVYVCEIEVDGRLYPGIADIGKKPTVKGNNPVAVEAHIFDFEKDLYGQEIRIYLKERTRGEEKFETLEALKAQLEQDIACGRAYFQM